MAFDCLLECLHFLQDGQKKQLFIDKCGQMIDNRNPCIIKKKRPYADNEFFVSFFWKIDKKTIIY